MEFAICATQNSAVNKENAKRAVLLATVVLTGVSAAGNDSRSRPEPSSKATSGVTQPAASQASAQNTAEQVYKNIQVFKGLDASQLDGAMSSIAALPPIARAVGSRIEVLMDGGIRSGQDVIKALALGAKGVLIGRAYIYGLEALGEGGVRMSLEIIRKELDVTMALCGLRDVKQVNADILAKR